MEGRAPKSPKSTYLHMFQRFSSICKAFKNQEICPKRTKNRRKHYRVVIEAFRTVLQPFHTHTQHTHNTINTGGRRILGVVIGKTRGAEKTIYSKHNYLLFTPPSSDNSMHLGNSRGSQGDSHARGLCPRTPGV